MATPQKFVLCFDIYHFDPNRRNNFFKYMPKLIYMPFYFYIFVVYENENIFFNGSDETEFLVLHN